MAFKKIRALLIDMDGVLIENGRALPGAREKFNALQAANFPLRILSNCTIKSRREVFFTLKGLGFELDMHQLITAPFVAAHLCRKAGYSRIYPLTNELVLDDFFDFEIDYEYPDVVVVGDIGLDFNYKNLNKAFQHLQKGVPLCALHKNRYTRFDGSFHLDVGAFVAALEYGANEEAIVAGKPSENFFLTGLDYLSGEVLELEPSEVLMIGDDIYSDIEGANAVGFKTMLVETGKYNMNMLTKSNIYPDYVLSSFATLDI